MNIAVIPARGGSKRIPRKNIRPFGGKPMMAYAIEAARASGLFEHVVVSTDDEQIASVAQACGATVPFMRPAELSDDQTVTVPVIAHAAQWFVDQGQAPQAVCCIYPCVPLLRAEDLRGAYALFMQRDAAYVYPVVAFHSSPWRGMTKPDDGPMKFVYPEYELSRTQDLPRCFYDAGQFYWGKTGSWTSGLRMHSNGHGYEMPAHRVVDVDTPDDWQRAEMMAKAA